MKRVMQQFEDRTTQRFHEYDERMKTTRQKCKDKCHKEIEKIILKDKMEKQMAQQLTTLETKIGTDDIPTCVCEKSMADKMEKDCLRCTYGLGTLAPTVGLIGSVAVGAWKPTALKAAIVAAQKAGDAAGVAAGEAAGKKAVILALQHFKLDNLFPEIYNAIVKIRHYADVKNFSVAIVEEHSLKCQSLDLKVTTNPTCETFEFNIGMRIPDSSFVEPVDQVVPEVLDSLVGNIKEVAEAKAAEVAAAKTAEFKIANVGAVESTYGSCQTAIIASIVAIVVIVLIMVIIYLILRYRRKKKMKKKLQYIKLLKE
ncbi:hypothetical protein PFNF54_01978 [Plasmodium falciparum NF54]|uniref:Rifin n=1 Tax=Plasmodium falciparum (isolate NF54) TaxID=5843 RepID=W7JX68_PLAFO|nr:hypothetical protein PFNF54_01978 [Plasmodium falciparum NF54]